MQRADPPIDNPGRRNILAKFLPMYFPDLTPYAYAGAEPRENTLNIGWLSPSHPFPRCAPDGRLVAALRRLAAAPVNLFRGAYVCEFCPPPSIRQSACGITMLNPSPGTTGNGEIRIIGADGTTYVAPVLVLHYVVAHGYLPPREFVDAALATAQHRPSRSGIMSVGAV
jgi:hypothetical protein